jgi:predicted amidohydrolase YtcJ
MQHYSVRKETTGGNQLLSGINEFYKGEERMQWSMAYRSFLDAGIPVAAGSDFSPRPFAPLMGIQGMVTRTGWNGETWGPTSESA